MGNTDQLTALYEAVIEATEEAIYNSLLKATTVSAKGGTVEAIPIDRVREILAKHGWFQTVLSDLPHFTFLGLKEKDLPKHGLRSLEINGQVFWIPNVTAVHPGLDK